jgi:endonuclease III
VTTGDPSKKLAALLRRLRTAFGEVSVESAGTIPPAPPWTEAALDELILSFLMWESTASKARAAMKRVRECVVDYNELRVCLAHELVEFMGERYPRATERAERMHAAFTDLYRREHGMTLARLGEAPKRDALGYLASLEGVPHYVAARVLLVSLGGHAVPVDDRLRALLVEEGVVEQGTTPEQASSWLEHHVRAADAGATHALLQAWSDEGQPRKDRKGEKAGGKSRARRQKSQP